MLYCKLDRNKSAVHIFCIVYFCFCSSKHRIYSSIQSQCLTEVDTLYSTGTSSVGSMATLSTTLPTTGGTAIIIPNKPNALTISYPQLTSHVSAFQKKLAQLGIHPQAAVSIALPNSYEFIVAFLAASWQRAIAAPLNPAYKQDEFEFYIDDLSSAVALVPRDSFRQDGPAVRAARNHQAAIAECYWNGHEVALDIKEEGKLSGKGGQAVQRPQPDDVALVLHTSGTTGRPKAVRSSSTLS